MRVVHLLCKVNYVIDANTPTTVIVGTTARHVSLSHTLESLINAPSMFREYNKRKRPRAALIKKAVQERNAAFLLHFFV